jgi:hypothetical protein
MHVWKFPCMHACMFVYAYIHKLSAYIGPCVATAMLFAH